MLVNNVDVGVNNVDVGGCQGRVTDFVRESDLARESLSRKGGWMISDFFVS
jgi:hypothetical protein